MENVRHLLYQYNSSTSLYLGHRFFVTEALEHGFMAGDNQMPHFRHSSKNKTIARWRTHSFQRSAEGFDQRLTTEWRILQKRRYSWCRRLDFRCLPLKNYFFLKKFVLGSCLKGHAAFVDCRDEKHQKRFFPVGVDEHFNEKRDLTYWYYQYLFYNASQGNLDCCSDTVAGMHYILAPEMHALECLVYNVHPFGLDKNLTEKLPRKLPFSEVVEGGEAESYLVEYFREQKSLVTSDQIDGNS